MATIEIQMAKRVGRRRTVIPAHQQRKKTDFLTVHDRSITFNVRQERVGQVHQWYSLARHVATSQADLRRSTRSKAPDSPGPGKQSTTMGKGALLKGTKMKQRRATSRNVVATDVG